MPQVFERLSHIDMPGGRTLVFHEELEGKYARDPQGYRYEIPKFAVSGHGRTRRDAQADAGNKIWEEADKLLHTLSHKLDDADLERKGLLLGHVDVVHSKISKPLGEFTWVLGQIERDAQGKAWFHSADTSDEPFLIGPEIEKNLPIDSFYRMAKVRAGIIGEPVGPVVELGPPLDDDLERTWAEWQRLMDGHD